MATKKPRKSTKKQEEAAQAHNAEWAQLMGTHPETPPQKYSMKSSYDVGTKIDHPTFGKGIVGKLIYPNKIECLFAETSKVLIHAGAPRE